MKSAHNQGSSIFRVSLQDLRALAHCFLDDVSVNDNRSNGEHHHSAKNHRRKWRARTRQGKRAVARDLIRNVRGRERRDDSHPRQTVFR